MAPQIIVITRAQPTASQRLRQVTAIASSHCKSTVKHHELYSGSAPPAPTMSCDLCIGGSRLVGVLDET